MHKVRPRTLLLACITAILVAGAGAPAIAQDATPTGGEVTILGPDESYAGATLGEWDAHWWQWAGSLPPEINPGVNVTGEACGYGQSGPVFFLPGTFSFDQAIQTCVVPEGTAIFVSVAGNECSTVEESPYFGRDEEDLRACATAATDTVTDVQASINGQQVPNIELYRITSPLFPLTFAEDNLFEAPAGVALSVADDYSFIIAPPAPGEYEIAVSGVYGEDSIGGTFRVIVEAPQVIEPAATPVASPEAATPVA